MDSSLAKHLLSSSGLRVLNKRVEEAKAEEHLPGRMLMVSHHKTGSVQQTILATNYSSAPHTQTDAAVLKVCLHSVLFVHASANLRQEPGLLRARYFLKSLRCTYTHAEHAASPDQWKKMPAASLISGLPRQVK